MRLPNHVRVSRLKIDIGQWIDNVISTRQTDLEKTKFLSITMKTVGFGIDRHAIDLFKLRKQLGEL